MSKSSSCLGCLINLLFVGFIGSILFGMTRCSIGLGNFNITLGGTIGSKEKAVDLTDVGNKKKAAEEAVKQFHSQLSKGKCKDIYEQANEAFKRGISQPNLLSRCEKMCQELGDIQSSRQVKWDWRPGNRDSDKYIALQYDTSFQNSLVKETFIWIVQDSKPELYLYKTDSIDSKQNPTI